MIRSKFSWISLNNLNKSTCDSAKWWCAVRRTTKDKFRGSKYYKYKIKSWRIDLEHREGTVLINSPFLFNSIHLMRYRIELVISVKLLLLSITIYFHYWGQILRQVSLKLVFGFSTLLLQDSSQIDRMVFFHWLSWELETMLFKNQ